VSTDELGVTHGRVHMESQDFLKLQLKKSKAVRAELRAAKRASKDSRGAGAGAGDDEEDGGDDGGDGGADDGGEEAAPPPVRAVGSKAARGAR
jgi:hypothetical protein